MTYKRLVLALLVLAAACASRPSTAPVPQRAPEISIIPLPQTVQLDAAQRFALDSMTTVYTDADADSSVAAIAGFVQAMLSPYVKTAPAKLAAGAAAPSNSIRLILDASKTEPEGYEVVVSPTSAVITAGRGAGLFHGGQSQRPTGTAVDRAGSWRPGTAAT